MSSGSMWADIDNALGEAMGSNLSASSAGNDLYECYIWSIVLEAAKREGATIRLFDRSGNVPNNFLFRTSPSSIFSENKNYCHAEITFHHCASLEAHVGVYLSGKSKVIHECDVAVIDKLEADICRSFKVNPRSSKVLLAVECKYYILSSLGVNLGRSFLGLTKDILADRRFFVSTQRAGSVGRLLSYHRKEYEIGVSPTEPELENRLRGSFEKIFRDYKALSLT